MAPGLLGLTSSGTKTAKEGEMTKFVAIGVAASVLGLSLAVGAHAQQQPPARPPAGTMPPSGPPQTERPAPPPRPAWTAPEGVHESSTLIGARVRTAEGKEAGSIEQLLIDPKEGKITHAVLGMGGFLGLGETRLVVPWSNVKLSPDPRNPNRTVAMMDQATLDQAPRYEKRQAATDRGMAPGASPATSPRLEPPKADTDVKRDSDVKREEKK